MINPEQFFHKAQALDAAQQQELTDFLDFLLSKQQTKAQKEPTFSVTQLESIDSPNIYHGKPLSLQEMQQAIDWEAGNSI
jgi:hypothetical protein